MLNLLYIKTIYQNIRKIIIIKKKSLHQIQEVIGQKGMSGLITEHSLESLLSKYKEPSVCH